MKYTLSLILLFALHGNSTSQTIRFCDFQNKWSVSVPRSAGGSCYQCKLHYAYADSFLINGYIYYSLTASGNTTDSALIREDISAGKVYAKVYKNSWTTPDTSEVLLYDYNLQVGDTFKIMASPTHLFIHVVDSVGTVMLTSTQTTKAIHMVPVSMFGEPYWIIEGIGSTNTPLFPFFPFSFEQTENLYCFTWLGTAPYIQPAVGSVEYAAQPGPMTVFAPYNNGNTCTLLSIADVQVPHNDRILLTPQPASHVATLKLPHYWKEGTFTLLSSHGQVQLRVSFFNKGELTVPHPGTPGIYIYRLQDKALGKTFTGKIVFN